MRVTRLGHACLLVETREARVLVDPGVFSSDEAFTVSALDAVVVTHQHPDHLDPGRIAGLVDGNRGARLWCDPETAAQDLPGAWTATRDGWTATIGDLTLTGVGERHAPILPALPVVANVGILLAEDDGPTLFHPGDSYASAPPGVDVLALPLSAPWAKISETVEFARAVAPRRLFPVHDGTISDRAYDIYWNHVANHAGVPDCLRLGHADSVVLDGS